MAMPLLPLEGLEACAERLEHLNCRFPELASENSLSGVESWRQLCSSNNTEAEGQPEDPRAIAELALPLLQRESVEEVVAILAGDHGFDGDLKELVRLVGAGPYGAALAREVRQLADNAVSYQQIAGLWNDLDRPVLGGERWSADSVSVLVS